MREEGRLRVCESRVLRIFGPKRDKVNGSGENDVIRSLIICAPHPELIG